MTEELIRFLTTWKSSENFTGKSAKLT